MFSSRAHVAIVSSILGLSALAVIVDGLTGPALHPESAERDPLVACSKSPRPGAVEHTVSEPARLADQNVRAASAGVSR
jgi:hypothetical protein